MIDLVENKFDNLIFIDIIRDGRRKIMHDKFEEDLIFVSS